MSRLDAYVSQFNQQVPSAPEGLLNAYVKWGPWLAIVFGVLGLIASLALFGLGAVLGPLLLLAGASGVAAGGMALVTGILGVVTGVLDVVGGYWMLRRQLNGWWLVAFAIALGLLANLLSVSLVGIVISALIGYVHLQVRPSYS